MMPRRHTHTASEGPDAVYIDIRVNVPRNRFPWLIDKAVTAGYPKPTTAIAEREAVWFALQAYVCQYATGLP